MSFFCTVMTLILVEKWAADWSMVYRAGVALYLNQGRYLFLLPFWRFHSRFQSRTAGVLIFFLSFRLFPIVIRDTLGRLPL